MFNIFTILYIFFIALLGFSIGSFLNALVYRLHSKKTLFGRSECPNCLHKLAWYDLIPLFSFISLKGKCRYCKQKISWQYFFVELATGLLFIIFFVFNYCYRDFNILVLIRDYITITALVAIFVYDVKYMEIPDEISIPTIVIISILNIIITKKVGPVLTGATFGACFFLIQFIISKGKWIGGGDIRLGLLIGVLFGPQKALFAIFLSYFIGAIYAIPILINKYFNKKEILNGEKQQTELPLAPFLASGTILVMLFSEYIVKLLS